jgi:hypothetical protein
MFSCVKLIEFVKLRNFFCFNALRIKIVRFYCESSVGTNSKNLKVFCSEEHVFSVIYTSRNFHFPFLNRKNAIRASKLSAVTMATLAPASPFPKTMASK